ncbi:MAG: T9SS type B sorting domain-containing protein, partial [Bacteroidota bacterium]
IRGQFSSFRWSNGATGPNIEVNEAGTYQLTVTNTQGCELIMTHDLNVVDLSARVDIGEPSCPTTATGSLNIQAFGDTDLLYSFDGGVTFGPDNLLEDLFAGQYEVVVENPLGCQWSTLVELPDAVEIQLLPSQPEQITIERGDSLLLEVGANFEVAEWSWNTSFGLSCSDCSSPVARPLANVTYVLTATTVGGCVRETSFDINVLDFRRAYAPSAFSPNMDGENDYWEIYPGPRITSIADFTIFDRWGGTLYRKTGSLPPGDERLRWDGTSDGQQLPTGTFGYAATLNFHDGSSRVISGTINLIR